MTSSGLSKPRPVLKWAGGKRQLLPAILERLPERIGTYYEPFVGGGALFFELAGEKSVRFERAVIADKNQDLVEVYRALQKDVERVLAELQKLADKHSEAHYYRVRDKKPKTLAARAARMIYLNRTGFNGLYRVNSSGEYNVPFGRYENPKIVDSARLRAAAQALTRVEILVADFEEVCRSARAGDAVYLDPPYLPVSRTARFAQYHNASFGLEEHKRLARVFGELERAGVCVVLSNSHTAQTRELFAPFACNVVLARRAINRDGAGRGPVRELLVVSRTPERRRPTRRAPLRAR